MSQASSQGFGLVGADGLERVEAATGLVVDAGCPPQGCCDEGDTRVICCTSDAAVAAILGTPINDCGWWRREFLNPPAPPVYGTRTICLVECRETAVVDWPSSLAPGGRVHQEAELELVRPVSFTGRGCPLGGRALFRYRWRSEQTGRATEAVDYEFCGAVGFGCPPIGSSSQTGDTLVIAVGATPGIGLSGANPTHTLPRTPGTTNWGLASPGPPSSRLRARWTCNAPGTEFVYTATYEDTWDGGVTVRKEFIGRFRVATEEACDGTPSPKAGACPPQADAPCEPGPEAYLIAEPCSRAHFEQAGAGGRTVLFRAENVRGCAVVPTAWGCVRIAPDSPAITDPGAVDGVVDDRVIEAGGGGGVFATTCCKCESAACNSEPVQPPACWLVNGNRSDVTGEWVTAPAPVPGGTEGCCCGDNDVVTVLHLKSTFTEEHLNRRSINQIEGPISARRGESWAIGWRTRYEYLDQAGGPFPDEEYPPQPMGPWTCQATGGAGGIRPFGGLIDAVSGFGPPMLEAPHTFPGLHSTRFYPGVRSIPCPGDPQGGLVDGRVPGDTLQWERFQISGTCTLLVFECRFSWEVGNGQRAIVEQELRIRIDPGPASDPRCIGGCADGVVGGTPAAPGNPTNPEGPETVGGGGGGCGGCGGGGGIGWS